MGVVNPPLPPRLLLHGDGAVVSSTSVETGAVGRAADELMDYGRGGDGRRSGEVRWRRDEKGRD